MLDRELNNPNWLVVGGAPGAGDCFDNAMGWCSVSEGRSITTNAGWQYFATNTRQLVFPSLYWLSDTDACEIFARPKRSMQRLGTRIITARRRQEGLELRGLADADYLVGMAERNNEAEAYEFGRYLRVRLSGLICLQIAANHCPRDSNGVIVLVGMTGYRSTPTNIVRDTCDGRFGKAQGKQHTRDIIRPFTQSVIDARPDVHFIVAGPLGYELDGPNVNVTASAEILAAALSDLRRSA